MIRTPSVSLDFKKLSIPEKIIFANNVTSSMTINVARFTTPDVPIVTLNQKITALSTAAQQATSGDHQKIVAMHSAEKVLDVALETEAHYVDRIALSDASTILLSGFNSTPSQTQPAVNPSVVTGIKVTASQQPGNAHIECDVMHSATGFMYFVSTTAAQIILQNNQFQLQNNPGVVGFINDTHRKVNFSNLPSGQGLFLSVVAYNRAGIGAANAPVTFKTL